ncbi:MAG: IPT/TIG domain-containing protein [Planctomycetes bacterium]|nr:IPT/TIG domain-containing protein [Planctomycetota bacterium]
MVGPGGTSTTSAADHFTYSAPSAPTVTALSPTSGSTGGGTVVILTGTNFTGTTGVKFGAVPATIFFINSATTITAVAPSQAAATVNVTVTTAAGTSATGAGNQFTYTAAAAPSITSLSPNAGKTVGLIQLLINGSNLSGATTVSFGGTAVSFLPVSNTVLIATVPAHASGSVSVTVTTPSGTSSGVTFTYSSNTAPTAAADTYSVGSSGTLTVSAASGVLSNDSDGNGDPLFVSWYSAPSHGNLVMNGDGSFTYVRNAGYSGGDSFTYKASDGLAESGSAPVTIQIGFPEHAAGGELPRQPGVADLTADALRPIVDAAIQRYAEAGVDAAGLAILRAEPVQIRDLSGDLLGLTIPDGIVLDSDAAGYGWFVDATPGDDVEFSAGGGTVLRATSGAALGRMDLLTVVTHELGHLLGRPDLDAAVYGNDIMADSLAPGVRRLLQEARPDAAGTLAAIASLPPRLDADRPLAVLSLSAAVASVWGARQGFLLGEGAWSIPAAPPNPGPSPQPSRSSSDLLLGSVDGLISALQAPALRDSDLVHVLGRWGTEDEDHPVADTMPQDTQQKDTASETVSFASGDHPVRDWLFAHPEDADVLLTSVLPN